MTSIARLYETGFTKVPKEESEKDKTESNDKASPSIKLVSTTQELHLTGQHDQSAHGRPGGKGSLGARSNTNRAELAKKIAIGVGAALITAGLVYGGYKLHSKYKEVNAAKEYYRNTLNGKSNAWASQEGFGQGAGKSRRRFAKTNDANNHDVFWTEEDGLPVKRVYQMETLNGKVMKVYDQDGTLADAEIEEMMNAGSYMNEMYDMEKPINIVITNPRNTGGKHFDSQGWAVIANDPKIYMNADLVQSKLPASEITELADTAMPVAKSMSVNSYTVIHEFGHKIDAITGAKSAGGDTGLQSYFPIRNALSPYGRTNRYEAYAESFTEWHATAGRTDNFAARTYAENEGWIGAGRLVEAVA